MRTMSESGSPNDTMTRSHLSQQEKTRQVIVEHPPRGINDLLNNLLRHDRREMREMVEVQSTWIVVASVSLRPLLSRAGHVFAERTVGPSPPGRPGGLSAPPYEEDKLPRGSQR